MKLVYALLFALSLSVGACTDKEIAKADATAEREGEAFRKGMKKIGEKTEEIVKEGKKDFKRFRDERKKAAEENE